MKVAYFDCPTGVSGDMCLGALLDAGVPIDYLTQHLDRLGIAQDYQLTETWVNHNGQRARKAIVKLKEALKLDHSHDHHSHDHHSHDHHSHDHHSHDHHSHDHHSHDHHSHTHDHSHDHSHTRRLPEIEQMIRSAQLPDRARDWSLSIFQKLAIAEGAVHGIPPEQVHFHEVGAIDAIVDIVGTCLGLDWLEIEAFYCSALPTGGGTVWAAHGRLPVPVPAVLKLFEEAQVPVYYNAIDRELVTPTGAAIVTTLAHHFGHSPRMTLQKVALGAGTIELPIPNILRLWIGETNSTHSHSSANHTQAQQQTIVQLETQLDDLSPQTIAYTASKLLSSGALDVFSTAIGMKKSRLGTLLSVICYPEQADLCEQILFEETSTLGIRRSMQQRTALGRSFKQVEVQGQPIQVKVAQYGDRVVHQQPEYEDCAAAAKHLGRPLKSIQAEASQLL